MALRVHDLILIPHGGARIGKQVAIIDGVFGDEVHIRRWCPSHNCFASPFAIPIAQAMDIAPITDRRVRQIRAYMGHKP